MERVRLAVLTVAILLFSLLSISVVYESISAKNVEQGDKFLSEYMAYVYASRGDAFNVTIYWCPSTSTDFRAIVRVPMFKGWEKYNSSTINMGPNWYRELQIQIPVLMNHSAEFSNVPVDIEIIRGDVWSKYKVSLGNWSFEIENYSADLKVIAHNGKVFFFRNDTAFISYEIGLLNPTDQKIYLKNITYHGLPGVTTVAIACYNVTSPFDLPSVRKIDDIPRDRILTEEGCVISPGKRVFAVMYMEVQPSVSMFFIRPKIVYAVGNETKTMPGETLEFVKIAERCGAGR